MKTSKNFIFRNVAGEGVLVPTGKAAQKFNGMLTLTDTAAFIWKQIDSADSIQAIADALQEEYEVDPQTALRDVTGMMIEFYRHGMVTEVPEFSDIPVDKSLE